MPTWNSQERFSYVRTGVDRTYRVTRAAAELAISADKVRRQQGVGAVRGGSDVALKYRNFKTEAGWKVNPLEEKAFRLAGDAFTVTGGILSAIALPTMAKKAATSFTELKALIHDPTATADARLNKVEELARASGGTIFAAQGVVMGTKGTIGILSRAEGVARVVTKVTEPSGKFMRFLGTPFGKVLNVLLPIADATVLVGELIATRRAFSDPNDTATHRARKVLDLGLATIKTAFWIFPQARFLKAAYGIASFGQLALTIKDYWPQIKPNAVKVAQAIGWGVTHPIEAVGAIVTNTVKGIGWVGAKLGSALAWTADKVMHPVTTWNNAWTEVSAWMRAYYDGKAQQIGSIFNRQGVPGVPGQPQPQIAYAPTAPVAPIAVPSFPAVIAGLPAVQPSVQPAAYAPAAAPLPMMVAAAPPPPPVAPPPPPPAPVPAPAPAPMLAAAPAPLPVAPAALPYAAAPVVLAAAADPADPLAQIRAQAQAAANT